MYKTIGKNVIWATLCLALMPTSANAGEVKAAVAANFTAAMREIAGAFHHATGHSVKISYGSTGKLYAQILHGAPFHVFLSADQDRPARLEAAGKASERFTYATGKLVVWSSDAALVDDRGEVLTDGRFKRLAIANPKTAPYGAAAMGALNKLGLADQLGARLVRGDSIAQTYQFVATGNAELGFVARAQVALEDKGSGWLVPQKLYDPIHQDAVLLEAGRSEPAAVALVAYLQSPGARAIIERFGYEVADKH